MADHPTPSTTAAGDMPAHAHSPWAVALSGLLALAVAMGIGRFAFTPIMPMMMQDRGLSISAAGLLAAANYAGYLAGALLARHVAGREAAAIRAGLLATGVLTAAMALPYSGAVAIPVMLLLRFLAGVASAIVLVSVSAWALGVLARQQRGNLSGVVFAGVGTGIALAGLACLGLGLSGAGSAVAWAMLGIIALAVPVLLWTQYRGGAQGAPATAGQDGEPAWRWSGGSMLLVACYGVFGFGYILPATFLPVMAARALSDPALVGWSWPLFGIAAALSTLFAGVLARRWSSRQVWMGAHWVMAAGVALPAWRETPFAVFVAALFTGGTFMLITLCAMQEARRLAGRQATRLIAAMTASFALGQIVGPLLVSLGLGKNGDFSAGLWLAAFSMAATGLLLARPASPLTPAQEQASGTHANDD